MQTIVLKRDKTRKQPVMTLFEKENVPFLRFPKLIACQQVDHLFGTRLGGASSGQFSSMNFSRKLGDDPENVLENFRRIASILECDLTQMVGTVQTHSTNIRRVTGADGGKGILIEPDYTDVDGLVTNERGVTLCGYVADCVPLFLVDPVKNAVGLAHSGWRGTASNMAGKMVRCMQEEFGSAPEDLIVAIGPSICQDCYEVDEIVANCFLEMLGDDQRELEMIAEADMYGMCGKMGLRRPVQEGEKEGKYQLDLWLTNMILFLRAGVSLEHMDVTDLCTSCNKDLLFSHRASHGKRGNLGAFIRLR